MTIYVDVLLTVNLYINYFLIKGSALIIRYDITTRRTIISSGLGALFSLIILLPDLPFIITVLIKIVSGVIIVFTAFGYRKPVDLIISCLCFLIISFIYAGTMLGLWLFAAPFGMFYRNGTAYFNIPIIAVAAFTALSYAIIKLVSYIADRRALSAKYADIEIISDNIKLSLKGISDSGNSLTDPFSGRPVIISSHSILNEILPSSVKEYLSGNNYDNMEGLRLVPCHTISGQTIIPVFLVERIIINGKPVNAAVGVCRDPISGAECIFNPNLISM